MLTRTQIQRFAHRNGIGIQAQERDYIQHMLLYAIYSHTRDLVFKGGTALRIVYKGNRFSEDLDFNGTYPVEKLKSAWGNALNELGGFGVYAEIRNEWQSDTGYSFDVSYRGPLYDGRDRTNGKVRVDINLRPENVDTQRELISAEYDDLRPFVVIVLTPAHLLAEKIRALLVRGKARDVYDIWLLKNRGASLQKGLAQQKMQLYGAQITRQLLDEALLKSAKDWDRDLGALLPGGIRWEEVAGQLAPFWEGLFQDDNPDI